VNDTKPCRISRITSRGHERCRMRWSLSPHPSPLPRGEYVFSQLAAPVAQTWSLPYRRFSTCQPPLASNVLPITNRRYGRLKICATLNTYRGEGEPFPSRRTIQISRLSITLCSLFPLPGGEGQGEGNRRERFHAL